MKNAFEPMWFRAVVASMGLYLDFSAVLESYQNVLFAVDDEVVHLRQPVGFPKLSQWLAPQILQVSFDLVLPSHALGN